MALTNPKAAVMNAKAMVDVRFVKELDDTDFIQSLDKNNFARQ